jgi:membrane fusion protein (multidrug efflux system)
LSQKDLDDSVGQGAGAAAAVEQAKANVTNARLNLDYTTITSPVSGLSSYAKKQVGSHRCEQQPADLRRQTRSDLGQLQLSENEVLRTSPSRRPGS